MHRNSLDRGFVGILALLICVSIILIIMFARNGGEEQTTGKSMVETNLDAVDSARDAKQLIENRDYSEY